MFKVLVLSLIWNLLPYINLTLTIFNIFGGSFSYSLNMLNLTLSLYWFAFNYLCVKPYLDDLFEKEKKLHQSGSEHLDNY